MNFIIEYSFHVRLLKDLFLNESGGGWLIDKMKKKRAAIRKQRKKEDADQISDQEIASEENNVQTDFDILKATIVTNESMKFIKRKLVATQQYRQQMLADLNSHLIECFPYFFACPELVSVFFCREYALL